MKINLKSNLKLPATSLETPAATLSELLDKVAEGNGILPLYPDCEVLVNGRSYQVLPDGLATRLREGDRVEITMFMLGGG
ncbi:MAG: MoaD/ThiS family protein [Chloroflexota bacterium]